MKELREIKLEELTVEQKLSFTMNMVLHGPADEEFVYDLIKKRAVGSVWIQMGHETAEKRLAKIKEIADYPLLVITDAGSGWGEYMVGKHNAVGATGSAKHAYAFGKLVGVMARKAGYNVVCDPVVDMIDGSMRSMGTDKEKVAELALAMSRGMHDGGILSIAKHYPGGVNASKVDSHMAESTSLNTESELWEHYLYPYRRLNEEGLLDGIMTKHCRFVNIDDKYPASLSKKVIDVFRTRGFNGFAITDALCMMGIRAKFSDVDAKGLALSAGNDILLPYTLENEKNYNDYLEAYKKGLISDEALDTAVKRVLEAQHKVMLLPKDAELTSDELETFKSINKDGVYERVDEGVEKTISRDGKHYFIVSVDQNSGIKDGRVDVDTFSGGWQKPKRIGEKLKELFPNSTVQFIHEFPSQYDMQTAVTNSIGYSEVIVVTFSEALAYVGPEFLTHRTVSLINAMQLTDRISTLIHFGNPRVLDELSHIKRVILGGQSVEGVDTAFEVLAGLYPAKGTPTYELKLK